jgi:periplasmic protein TonB
MALAAADLADAGRIVPKDESFVGLHAERRRSAENWLKRQTQALGLFAAALVLHVGLWALFDRFDRALVKDASINELPIDLVTEVPKPPPPKATDQPQGKGPEDKGPESKGSESGSTQEKPQQEKSPGQAQKSEAPQKPAQNAEAPTKPATAEPPKPEAAKPETPKPEAAKPEAAKPEPAKPEAPKPESAKPEPAKPETPDPAKSEAQKPTKPEAQKADLQKPIKNDARKPPAPEAAKPDARKAELQKPARTETHRPLPQPPQSSEPAKTSPPDRAQQEPTPPRPQPAPRPEQSQQAADTLAAAHIPNLPAAPLQFGTSEENFRAMALPQSADDGDDLVSYSRLVFSRLEIAKRFPEAALARGAQGIAGIGFTLDESGNVLDAEILVSSGDADLDEESVALVHRSAPFPPPPPGAQRRFNAVISFDHRSTLQPN